MGLWALAIFGSSVLAPEAAVLPSQSRQVVDRLLAVVNGRVVTAGDLDRYRAMAALVDGEELTEPDSELLDRVIEDMLIRAQVAQFPGVRVTDAAVDAYTAELSGAAEQVGFPLTPAEIRMAARDRLERTRYFDFRFSRVVRVSEEEVRGYYETVFLPAVQAEGIGELPIFDQVRDRIRANLIAEKTQTSIEEWTESLYRRNEIEVVE
jgi:hypothetical protein